MITQNRGYRQTSFRLTAALLFSCTTLNYRKHFNGVARINLHHIVFIAAKEEVEITLDNQLAKAGENLCVNFFAVTPFLLEE